MRVNDRPRDRESYSGTVRFRRNEWHEQLALDMRWSARQFVSSSPYDDKRDEPSIGDRLSRSRPVCTNGQRFRRAPYRLHWVREFSVEGMIHER
jgi:hypothetical protein